MVASAILPAIADPLVRVLVLEERNGQSGVLAAADQIRRRPKLLGWSCTIYRWTTTLLTCFSTS